MSTPATSDPRVRAIRTDAIVGIGTQSVAQKRYSDEKLVRYLDHFAVSDPQEAVNLMRRIHQAIGPA
jgi:hypothetical protein